VTQNQVNSYDPLEGGVSDFGKAIQGLSVHPFWEFWLNLKKKA